MWYPASRAVSASRTACSVRPTSPAIRMRSGRDAFHSRALAAARSSTGRVEADVRPVDRELRRVHADREASGPRVEVVAGQRPLVPLVEPEAAVERERVRRDHAPAAQGGEDRGRRHRCGARSRLLPFRSVRRAPGIWSACPGCGRRRRATRRCAPSSIRATPSAGRRARSTAKRRRGGPWAARCRRGAARARAGARAGRPRPADAPCRPRRRSGPPAATPASSAEAAM